MNNDLLLGAHTLGKGSIDRLHRSARRRVACLSGSIWITQDGDLRDIVLGAGESFDLDRPGDALISALDDSRYLLLGEAQSARH